ncbi:biofilm development protein YmgB/AriR [Pantoea sp. PNA 03-3]|nr:biofilm development protein YmgB/AriR [Pantoea sp. PNA 03-3]
MQPNITEQNILQVMNEHSEQFAAEAEIVMDIVQRLKARNGRVLRKDVILSLITEMESSSDIVRLDVLRCALEIVVYYSCDVDDFRVQ